MGFSHELGHLLGCRHNPQEDPEESSAHGKIIFGADPANPFYPRGARTIMAYSTYGGDETRVNQWSNPDVQFLGHATGTPNVSDCAAQIRHQAPIVAKWAKIKKPCQVDQDD